MKRVPEPELMNERQQVEAYADADFEQPHNHFIQLLRDRIGALPATGRALDLGCGPGDIAYRLADEQPGWLIDAIDGAPAMIERAHQDPRALHFGDRIRFIQIQLPNIEILKSKFHLIVCNSLLHHLKDPRKLWPLLPGLAQPDGQLFMMDLKRPADEKTVVDLVNRYARNEPEILQRDFEASLRAAYTVQEISAQLSAAGLDQLQVEDISDRHWIVYGAIHRKNLTREGSRKSSS